MPEILRRLAPQLGAEVVLEPHHRIVGLIRFPNGRKSYFWDNKFNLNSVSAAKIAQDKGYTGHFLRLHGYSVPKTGIFFCERFRKHIGSQAGLAAALSFAEKLGWPVIVKPCRRSQGDGVALAGNRREFLAAARVVFKYDRTMLVQEARAGRDYRIVVLDGKVISAYERVPLAVTGDGRQSIRELLKELQREFDRTGRDTRIPMDDPRIKSRLRRFHRTLDSVPAKGERVQLFDIANLSVGGATIEITRRLHPSFARLAAGIARDMDLRFAGVDVIAPDATKPLGRYSVLEINSAPGLDHYASFGPEHEARIDALYLKVLKAVARRPH
jgi:D-alanine-D-alanine ligase-like ATP-grasp enzyme